MRHRRFPLAPVRLLVWMLAILVPVSPAIAGPALWHIADPDSDIYLLGTVHILPPDLDWRTPEIEQAFESADTVWFEAPANDPAAQLEMVLLVQKYGLNPPGVTLSSLISQSARAALGKLASDTGLPVAGLETLRPWLAAVTLTSGYVQAQGYDPESGVEARLWPLASARGKKLDYFETLEEQLRFFADLPEDVEVGLFEQTVMEYTEGGDDQLDLLVAAWQMGDVTEIDRLVNGEMREEAPEIYDVVITRRNENWVRRIQELLAGSGSHFIALGAGHLAGDDGVVELLRAAGVEVAGP